MEYPCGFAGIVLVRANPSFQTSELKYILEKFRSEVLFLIVEFRDNPMASIAREAKKDSSPLREVVNLENYNAMYAKGEKPAIFPILEAESPAQIQIHQTRSVF